MKIGSCDDLIFKGLTSRKEEKMKNLIKQIEKIGYTVEVDKFEDMEIFEPFTSNINGKLFIKKIANSYGRSDDGKREFLEEFLKDNQLK